MSQNDRVKQSVKTQKRQKGKSLLEKLIHEKQDKLNELEIIQKKNQLEEILREVDRKIEILETNISQATNAAQVQHPHKRPSVHSEDDLLLIQEDTISINFQQDMSPLKQQEEKEFEITPHKEELIMEQYSQVLANRRSTQQQQIQSLQLQIQQRQHAISPRSLTYYNKMLEDVAEISEIEEAIEEEEEVDEDSKLKISQLIKTVGARTYSKKTSLEVREQLIQNYDFAKIEMIKSSRPLLFERSSCLKNEAKAIMILKPFLLALIEGIKVRKILRHLQADVVVFRTQLKQRTQVFAEYISNLSRIRSSILRQYYRLFNVPNWISKLNFETHQRTISYSTVDSKNGKVSQFEKNFNKIILDEKNRPTLTNRNTKMSKSPVLKIQIPTLKIPSSRNNLTLHNTPGNGQNHFNTARANSSKRLTSSPLGKLIENCRKTVNQPSIQPRKPASSKSTNRTKVSQQTLHTNEVKKQVPKTVATHRFANTKAEPSRNANRIIHKDSLQYNSLKSQKQTIIQSSSKTILPVDSSIQTKQLQSNTSVYNQIPKVGRSPQPSQRRRNVPQTFRFEPEAIQEVAQFRKVMTERLRVSSEESLQKMPPLNQHYDEEATIFSELRQSIASTGKKRSTTNVLKQSEIISQSESKQVLALRSLESISNFMNKVESDIKSFQGVPSEKQQTDVEFEVRTYFIILKTLIKTLRMEYGKIFQGDGQQV